MHFVENTCREHRNLYVRAMIFVCCCTMYTNVSVYKYRTERVSEKLMTSSCKACVVHPDSTKIVLRDMARFPVDGHIY